MLVVPLVVHYWADLHLVYRFRCYDNSATLLDIGAHDSIAANANCQRVPAVLALCLVNVVTGQARDRCGPQWPKIWQAKAYSSHQLPPPVSLWCGHWRAGLEGATWFCW